jgi:hypothetical protein
MIVFIQAFNKLIGKGKRFLEDQTDLKFYEVEGVLQVALRNP